MTAKPTFHRESRQVMYRSDNDWPKARILALQAIYTSMQKLGVRIYAVSIAPNPNYPHVAAAIKEEGIPSEDGTIPPEYEDLKEVISKTRAQAVLRHVPQDLTIDLMKGKEAP